MTRVVGGALLFVTSVLLATPGPGSAQEGSTGTRTLTSTDGSGRGVTRVERYVVNTPVRPAAMITGVGQAGSRATAGARTAGVKPRPMFGGPGVTISSTGFGSAPVAGQSVTMTLTFDATSGPLTVAATVGQEFTVTSSTCTSGTCSAVVTFAPAYPGLRDDAITATNTSSGTLVAKTFVYGTGVGPQFGYQLGSDSGYQGFLNAPTAIAVGPDRVGYVTDAATNQVYRFNRYDPNGLGFRALPITGLAAPGGVAVDGSNTVFVADQTNNAVVTYSSAGVQGTLHTSALSSPEGLAVDGTGAVYIADTGNNRILKIDNQGAETTIASSLNSPAGVAVDAAGDVFFTDQGSAGEVVELPAGGGAAMMLATSVGTPLAIAVDGGGAVYFTNGTVLTILLAGGAQSSYGGNGEVGVAVAPNGDLYTAIPGSSVFHVTDRSSGNFIVHASVGGMGQGGITIANTGNAPLNLGELTVSEAVYSRDSSSQCTTGYQLAAGATCDVTIDYNPVAPGADTQTFNADSNSSNVSSQNMFALYGSAGNTATTETASSNSVSTGQPVTFTATVNDNDSSATPTGTVVFQDGNDNRTTIGMGTLGAGTGAQATATLTTSSLSVGQHPVRAVYQGSGTLAASTSDAQTVTVVAGAAATMTSLTGSAANINAGAAETLTATIQAAASPGVTGTVTFYDQSGALGSGAVTATTTGGTASLTITFLSVGSHQIYGLYNGDGAYAPSTTGTQTVVVARASTTASLALSAATISAGQAETLTATVAGAGSPVATGTVTFTQGVPSVPGTTLGTVTVTATSTGGTASLTVSSLPVGSDPVYASYSGDTNYGGSVAGTQTVTVTAASMGTTTTLTVDRASVVYRTPIALTATVLNASGGAAAVGQVIFCDAAAAHCSPELSLATAQVNVNGIAVARMPAGIVGSHSFTATFLGTGSLGRSVSAPLTVTVTMQSPYSTYTTISSTGSAGNYGLTASVVGLSTRAASPGGTVTFNDTTNANAPVVLGTGTLGAAVLGFQAVQPIGSPNAVGRGAYGVATGDFNADGYPDVVVENYNAGTVSVLLGKGNGEFQPQVTYAVGSLPERVLVADFNGDGKLDLVVANSGSGTVGILLGNGDGTFQPQVTYGTSGTPVGLGVMDVNHDGIADIVAGNYYESTVGVLLGNGDGTFRTAVTYGTGSTPQTLAEGDFNGDGNVDLAVGNLGSSTVGILLGNGDGTFRAQVSYPVGPQPQGVQVGDFNGDGNDDLAVTNSGGSGTVSVLLGNGDGTFQPQVAYGVGSNPVGVVIADFNGDGFQDISVGNTASSTLTQSVLLGNGDGTFQTQKVFRTGNFPYGEAVADFNGDGFPDLAIANFNDGTATILLSEVLQTATASISGVSLGSPTGTHTVTASYGGDANFSASTSPAVSLMSSTPTQAATVTALTVMPGTQTVGLGVVFSVSVSNGSSSVPTGSVTLMNVATTPAAVLGTIALGAGGSGTFSTAGLPVGSYRVVASYGGDGANLGSVSAAQGLTVAQAVTATVLGVSAGSVTVGQGETLTATISGNGMVGATGTVTFADQNGVLGTGVVAAGSNGGTATLTLASLAVGAHRITASYGGDVNDAASVSAAQTVTVNAVATTTALQVSAAAIAVGQTEMLSATVAGSGAGALAGTVTFSDQSGVLGSGTVVGGSATFALATLFVGTHRVTASYGGSANYAPSVSAGQTVTVNAAVTTTVLQVSAAALAVGQTETLSATVAGSGGGALSGTVTFSDQSGVLGSGTVAGGSATLALATLSVGTHQITASYGGSANYGTSASAAQTVTVNPVVTTTALQVSGAAISLGQTETLSASVSGSGAGVLSGTVTFSDQNGVLGSGTIVGGSATLALATLSVGTHRITASYGGSANYGTSVSAAQSVVVSLVAQTIAFPAIANHSVGDTAFSLNATASSGLAVTYALLSGPATLSGSSVTVTGVGTVVVQAAQAGNATYAAATAVTQSFTVVAAPVPVIAAVSPATAVIGAAATTVTLTGTNFAARDAVQLNGATIGSTFVNATLLTATIPATFLAASGTGQLAVIDAASGTTSGTAAFVVLAKPTVAFSGPATSASGQQPAVTVQLVNPYPAVLTGTLTLAFAPSSSSGIDDPAVQFASGGRTLTFTVPANSTLTPPVQLQTGTVAGTATITLGLVSSGLNVTPANAAPVVIAIAAAVPAVTTATLTRAGSTLSVVVHGFSNTREVATATFHFTAATGSTISTPDVTVTVAPVFATWYGSTASTQYGSSFTYTQQFTLDADVSTVGSVTVMLVNAVGTSVSASAQ